MMQDWWMGWGAGGWGGMWFGPLFMVAFLVLAVVVIAALVRATGGGLTGSTRSAQTPRQILDERFARGEIDREDYEQRHKALET